MSCFKASSSLKSPWFSPDTHFQVQEMSTSSWSQDVAVPGLGLEGMVSPCKKFEVLRPIGTNCPDTDN